jgi:hypothetical protein
MMIFAAQTLDPSVPWWWQIIFVPVAVGVLSSLLAFLAALYLATRTELYRRLARWEPFARDMWSRKVVLYVDAFGAARAAMDAVTVAIEELIAGTKETEAAHKIRQEAFTKLYGAQTETSILLTERVNDPYGELVWNLTKLGAAANDSTKPGSEQAESLWQCCRRVRAIYFRLLEAARKDLGVEALSEKTLQAIIPELNNPSQEEQGHRRPHPSPLPEGEGTTQQSSP